MKFLRAYFRDEGGATAVEFAMISGAFLIMLFGIIEVGRIFWTWNALQYATEETARYAIVHTAASSSDLSDYAFQAMSGINTDVSASSLTVLTSSPTVAGVSFVQVDSSYVFSTLTSFLPDSISSLTLTASARVPIVP